MTAATHSLWLLPKEADAQRLAAIIVVELSQRFATSSFTPQLTLKGDSDLRVAALEARSRDACAAVAAVSEPVAAIATVDAYFRSFYAGLAPGPPMARLQQVLDTEAADALVRHVRSLYGTVASGPKAASVWTMLSRRPPGQARLRTLPGSPVRPDCDRPPRPDT